MSTPASQYSTGVDDGRHPQHLKGPRVLHEAEPHVAQRGRHDIHECRLQKSKREPVEDYRVIVSKQTGQRTSGFIGRAPPSTRAGSDLDTSVIALQAVTNVKPVDHMLQQEEGAHAEALPKHHEHRLDVVVLKVSHLSILSLCLSGKLQPFRAQCNIIAVGSTKTKKTNYCQIVAHIVCRQFSL